jgi:hypothetical protein
MYERRWGRERPQFEENQLSADDTQNALVYPEPPDYVRKAGIAQFLKLFGPGAIMASVTVGSGETLFASRAGAIFGYSLLWFIVLCAACKMIQVYTGARYMVLAGEHPAQAWARLPGPRGWFPGVLGGLSVICMPFWIGGLSVMIGTVLNWALGLDSGGEGSAWLYPQLIATAAIVAAVAFTVVQSYQVLEKVQITIVAVLLVGIMAALLVAKIAWGEAIAGLFTIKMAAHPEWIATAYPDTVAKETAFAAMVTFMAAIGGGTYDYVGYLGFYRDKAWGALGVKNDHGKPVIDESDANVAVGRQWLRAPQVDVGGGFLFVLIFTMAFTMLGAAILNPMRLVPEGINVLTPQAEFLTQFFPSMKYLYQLGIFLAIWGTLYGALEMYTRTVHECLLAVLKKGRKIHYNSFRLWVCLYAGIGGLILVWTVPNPVSMIGAIAPIALFACGLWCFAMIWVDKTVLPKALRMNVIGYALNIVAGIAMAGFGVKQMLNAWF